jgi:hypothetical protein
MDINIMQVAVGVFIGNVCTLIVFFCFKEFNRPDQQNISWRSLFAFVFIMGMTALALIAQKMDMQAKAHAEQVVQQ